MNKMDNIDVGVDDLFGDENADVGDINEELIGDNEMELEGREEADDGGGQRDDEAQEVDVETLERLKRLSKGAAKKVVRRPQPKLNSERLIDTRGLPALYQTSKTLKFKGKGHEIEDLNILMKALECWGHRLFPKMTFDEIIERLEKLGKKQGVKTVLKKMRLGMHMTGLTDEFVNEEEEDKENDRALGPGSLSFGGGGPVLNSTRLDSDALFDSILAGGTANVLDWPDEEDLRDLVPSTSAQLPSTSSTQIPSTSNHSLSLGPDVDGGWVGTGKKNSYPDNEDIQTKIARNRQKALDKLNAKRGLVKAGGTSALRAALNGTRSTIQASLNDSLTEDNRSLLDISTLSSSTAIDNLNLPQQPITTHNADLELQSTSNILVEDSEPQTKDIVDLDAEDENLTVVEATQPSQPIEITQQEKSNFQPINDELMDTSAAVSDKESISVTDNFINHTDKESVSIDIASSLIDNED